RSRRASRTWVWCCAGRTTCSIKYCVRGSLRLASARVHPVELERPASVSFWHDVGSRIHGKHDPPLSAAKPGESDPTLAHGAWKRSAPQAFSPVWEHYQYVGPVLQVRL